MVTVTLSTMDPARVVLFLVSLMEVHGAVATELIEENHRSMVEMPIRESRIRLDRAERHSDHPRSPGFKPPASKPGLPVPSLVAWS